LVRVLVVRDLKRWREERDVCVFMNKKKKIEKNGCELSAEEGHSVYNNIYRYHMLTKCQVQEYTTVYSDDEYTVYKRMFGMPTHSKNHVMK
jgi:hypothetical protein